MNEWSIQLHCRAMSISHSHMPDCGHLQWFTNASIINLAFKVAVTHRCFTPTKVVFVDVMHMQGNMSGLRLLTFYQGASVSGRVLWPVCCNSLAVRILSAVYCAARTLTCCQQALRVSIPVQVVGKVKGIISEQRPHCSFIHNLSL